MNEEEIIGMIQACANDLETKIEENNKLLKEILAILKKED